MENHTTKDSLVLTGGRQIPSWLRMSLRTRTWMDLDWGAPYCHKMWPASSFWRKKSTSQPPIVSICLRPEPSWRQAPGCGKLQLNVFQKLASQWTDDSRRTVELMLNTTVTKHTVCMLPCSTEVLLCQLGEHGPRGSWLQIVPWGIYWNNPQESHSSNGMHISLTWLLKTMWRLFSFLLSFNQFYNPC